MADEVAKQYVARHYNSLRARASGVDGPGIFTEAWLVVWRSGFLDVRANGNGKRWSAPRMLETALAALIKGRPCYDSQPCSRTGENPTYGIVKRVAET